MTPLHLLVSRGFQICFTEKVMIVPLHDSGNTFESCSDFLSFPTFGVGIEVIFGDLPGSLLGEFMAPFIIPIHVNPSLEKRNVFENKVDVYLPLVNSLRATYLISSPD